ncbi:Uncharacterized protein Rs2_15677 [Raphanus sativus]|nr:Uncharacterized protein Rs2_15677 [Raphanus sativus]
MNELQQQWRSNRVRRIVFENLGIKQPPFRIRSGPLDDVSFNDTHPTLRRFSLSIKGLVTVFPPSRCGCSDSGRPEGGYISKIYAWFQLIFGVLARNAELPLLLSCESTLTQSLTLGHYLSTLLTQSLTLGYGINTKGGVGIKKSNNLVSKNTGKSRTAIKEPKLLISHQPNSKQKWKPRQKSFFQRNRRHLSDDSKRGKKTMQLQHLLIISLLDLRAILV